MSATVSTLPLNASAAPVQAQEAEIRRVFELHAASARRLRTSTVEQRIARLKRLREVLLAHREEVVEAGVADFRRPAVEIEMTELMPVLMDISDTCRKLKKWLKPRRIRATAMMFGTRAWTRYEARGRCLIIAPWNYPVTLTLGPLVPAVACGNAVMVKTSEVAPNFSPFAAKYFQGTYLLGMAAAKLSKTGKLGSVSAFAIPELITSINAFTLGAQAVNPDVEVSVVWVNSWFDPAKEQEAAKALMAQNCDVIFSNAQDTPSVISACEEAGVYAFNLNSSMKKYAEKTYLGCVATDWSPFFTASVDAHLAGSFKGANTFLGVEDKVVQVVDWNPAIPADTMARIKETEAKIADGSFSPFTGPITKADGSEAVASGATMADAEIVAMDWHVKGVTTPLPK